MKNIKIRTDYVPKVNQKAKKLVKQTQICPKCELAIPIDEIDEHLRIELLDPKSREQKKRAIENQKGSNLLDKGNQIMENLKRLSEFRTDIFTGDDSEAKKKLEEEKQKAKQKEQETWDGFTSSIEGITSKVGNPSYETQLDQFRESLRRTENIGPKVPGFTAERVFFNQLLHPLPPKPGTYSPDQQPEPSSKKAKIDDTTMPGFISQEKFLLENPFPITIKIHYPNHPMFPITLSNIFVNSLVFDLKSKIHHESKLELSKIKLFIKKNGKPIQLNEKNKLAFYNLIDDSTIYLTES